MNIYLAGKPEDHEQFNRFADQLEADGFGVVSSWHRNDVVANLDAKSRQQQLAMRKIVVDLFHAPPKGQAPGMPDLSYKALGGPPAGQMGGAIDRFHSEIEAADCMIADLDTASMEAGFALASGKKLIAIGSSPSMMIPFFMDRIELAEDWPAARAKLLTDRILKTLARPFPGPEES